MPLPLILASSSQARRKILADAGLSFVVERPAVDEKSLQDEMVRSAVSAETMAITLAQAKALSVTHAFPDHLVVGADQVLVCDGQFYARAADPAQAFAILQALQGRTHELVSAVCVSHENKVVWSHAEAARLTMRDLDDAAIESYCARAGDVLTSCAGCYAIEGIGSWLFEAVEGDFFTIMGLPLLPLQHFLRGQGFGVGS